MDKDIQKLISLIRNGGATLPTAESIMQTKQGNFTCLTTLRLEPNGFFVDLAIPEESIPDLLKNLLSWKEGVKTVSRDDFWTVVGQLPEYGPFTASDVIPPVSHRMRMGGYWQTSLRFDRLQLCAHNLTEEEQRKQQEEFDPYWEMVMKRFGKVASGSSGSGANKTDVRMMAKIAGLRSPLLNSDSETVRTNPFLGERTSSLRDTCVLNSALGKIALIQDGDDLSIYVHQDRFAAAEHDEEDESKFDALLRGIGLAHCVNALPFYFERTQNTHTVNRWLRPMFERCRPTLTPFWEGLCIQTRGCEELVKNAAEYFHRTESKIEPLKHLLFVFHESDDQSIPLDIRLLSVCTLLEGLVTLLLDQRLTPTDSFCRVKRGAIEWAEAKAVESNVDTPMWSRFSGYVKGWGYTRPEEKWRRLCEILNLPWDGLFKEIHELWKEMRNPLSHGSHKEMDSTNAGRQLLALSQLGGAFNLLFAVHVGYQGPIQVSPYENKVFNIAKREP